MFFLYSKLQKRMSQLQAYCMLNIMECNYTCVDNCLDSLKWFQWKEMISFNVVFYDDTTNRWRTKYQVVPSEYVGAQQRFVKTNNFCRSKLGELQISNIIWTFTKQGAKNTLEANFKILPPNTTCFLGRGSIGLILFQILMLILI